MKNELNQFYQDAILQFPSISPQGEIPPMGDSLRNLIMQKHDEAARLVDRLITEHSDMLFFFINQRGIPHFLKTPILKAMSLRVDGHRELDSLPIGDAVERLFFDPFDDDIAYHAAELCGNLLTVAEPGELELRMNRLFEQLESHPEGRYASVTLLSYIGREESQLDMWSHRLSKVAPKLFLKGDTNTLDLLANLYNIS